MICTSMLELVRTGKFGPLHRGVARAAVRDMLGSPPAWGMEHSVEQATIWRYGDIELHFTDDVLSWIFSDQEDFTDGGETLRVDSWVVHRGLQLKEFESHLNNVDVDFTVAIPDYDSTQTHVICASGARFAFANETGEAMLGLVSWHTQT